MRKIAFMLLIGCAALAATVHQAAAEEVRSGKHAGGILLRGRAIGVLPQVSSSSVTPIGGRVEATDTAAPELDLSYFFTDNIALELIAASTEHHITAKGTALGEVDVGTVRLLPPSLTLQYHFQPREPFSPYLGVGINYTFFFNESAPGTPVSSVSYDNNFGAVIQAGFDYNFAGNWFLNVDVKHIFLSTTARINGGAVRADVDLDPTIIGFGIGYIF